MSHVRVLARNILGDWSGFAVHVLVTFFMTPFILHSLGDARYGVWLVMMGLTGMLVATTRPPGSPCKRPLVSPDLLALTAATSNVASLSSPC